MAIRGISVSGLSSALVLLLDDLHSSVGCRLPHFLCAYVSYRCRSLPSAGFGRLGIEGDKDHLRIIFTDGANGTPLRTADFRGTVKSFMKSRSVCRPIQTLDWFRELYHEVTFFFLLFYGENRVSLCQSPRSCPVCGCRSLYTFPIPQYPSFLPLSLSLSSASQSLEFNKPLRPRPPTRQSNSNRLPASCSTPARKEVRVLVQSTSPSTFTRDQDRTGPAQTRPKASTRPGDPWFPERARESGAGRNFLDSSLLSSEEFQFLSFMGSDLSFGPFAIFSGEEHLWIEVHWAVVRRRPGYSYSPHRAGESFVSPPPPYFD